MESPLNTTVSKFENYFNPDPVEANLWDWLNDNSQEYLIHQLRTEKSKEQRDWLKAKLSCVTVSGTFDNPRSLDTLKQHSGLVCIDIDLKSNLVSNFYNFKNIISKVSFVAYAGLSASGQGYFLIIPIEQPEKHIQHFLALEELFTKAGIKIDKACKDVSRLRGRSFDPDPYINHQARPFRGLLEPEKSKVTRKLWQATDTRGDDTRAWVERYITELVNRSIDITGTYSEWVDMGFALSAEFGETGREYFHAVSSFHPKYKEADADKQFTRCLKHSGSGKNIGSFFFACKMGGVDLKNSSTPKPVESKCEIPKPPPLLQPPAEAENQPESRTEAEELKAFFNLTMLPPGPIKINAWTNIIDPKKFIETNLARLESYRGKPRILNPVVNQLKEFQQFLIKQK